MHDFHASSDDHSGRSGHAEAIAGDARHDRSIRTPRPDEVEAILGLFAGEVQAGRMLPRTPAEVTARLEDWLVAEDAGQVIGCVSLVFFTEELCELRSLAVHADRRGDGLGRDLIRAALSLARARGMRRVLTLTRAVSVFTGAGFQDEAIENFPEKVWRDCTACPLRDRCDEVTLIYHVEPAVVASRVGSGI